MHDLGWRLLFPLLLGALLLGGLLLGGLILGGVLLGTAPAVAEEGRAPRPRLDRVDHTAPEGQTTIPRTAGLGKRGRGIAAQLRKQGGKPLGTLTRITRWVARNLEHDPRKAGDWRGVDQILTDGTHGGAADRALVIGVLARAASIPTTWVKSLPTAWLVAAKGGRVAFDEQPGHVFLEVHLDGGWRLFDPETARLYESYDPNVRLLPGDRLAFDKGGDPYALVLPNRARLWRDQVRAYVSGLDLAVVPWARSRDLLARWRVYVAGKGGAATYARATAASFGYTVEKSFAAAGFDAVLPEVRGKTLIVVCTQGVPALPREHWKALLPPGYEAALGGAAAGGKGFLAHELDDGTRVILVTASGYEAVEIAVSEALDR